VCVCVQLSRGHYILLGVWLYLWGGCNTNTHTPTHMLHITDEVVHKNSTTQRVGLHIPQSGPCKRRPQSINWG
jgi:hypothetical protein